MWGLFGLMKVFCLSQNAVGYSEDIVFVWRIIVMSLIGQGKEKKKKEKGFLAPCMYEFLLTSYTI